MFTPTIFLPEVSSIEKNVSLNDSKVHHLKNVLRIKDFDNVNISNGFGELFLGRLVKNHIEINSKKKYIRKNEISIFVPFLREKNRFRFMIEKLVELNVYRLFIGKTQNTQNTKVDSEKIYNWAASAVEQSGTPFFPKIEITDNIDYTIFSACFDISGDTFKKEKANINTFAIGPEGGWTKEELSNFQYKYKISDFSLRTDTAAITAVSLVM
tara:strand:+ start:103 stop:738 length:636 start_codon:yes stop_codon:yes gene_type:complete